MAKINVRSRIDHHQLVSVIIPVYNDPERLKVCLAALENQCYPDDLYEIIVIDNGSEKSVEPIIKKFDHTKFVLEKRPGSYCARNSGIKSAKGQIMAFTDSDCKPHPSWIEEGVRALISVSQCGLVGGRIELIFRNPQNPSAAEIYESVHAFNQKNMIEKFKHCTTANLFTFKRVIDDVGFFNDTLKSGGDVEWGKRVYEYGYKQVYAENALVYHPARYTLNDLYRKTIRVVGGVCEMQAAERYTIGGVSRDIYKVIISLLAQSKRLVLNLDPFRNMKNYKNKIKYVLVMAFVGITKIVEKIRLQSGGEPKRQ